MKIYELLDSQDKWTKGVLIRYDNNVAVSWCLLGAITRCYVPRRQDDIINLVKRNISSHTINEWNDAPERKYEDVITLVRELNI